MPIPIIHRKSTESIIASYNYTDIAEGTGVVIFYGADSGTANYLLASQTVYSQIAGKVNPSTMTFETSAFNLPRTIKGTAYLSCGIYEVNAGAYTMKVQIKKNSGGSISNCSSEITGTNINGNGAKIMLLIPIPLTQTNFKKGDILRCVVTPVGSPSGDTEIGIDPMGRDGTYITSPSMTTQFKLYIPFKIDL